MVTNFSVDEFNTRPAHRALVGWFNSFIAAPTKGFWEQPVQAYIAATSVGKSVLTCLDLYNDKAEQSHILVMYPYNNGYSCILHSALTGEPVCYNNTDSQAIFTMKNSGGFGAVTIGVRVPLYINETTQVGSIFSFIDNRYGTDFVMIDYANLGLISQAKGVVEVEFTGKKVSSYYIESVYDGVLERFYVLNITRNKLLLEVPISSGVTISIELQGSQATYVPATPQAEEYLKELHRSNLITYKK